MSHGGTWDLSLAFWPGSDSTVTKIASGTDSGTIKVWTIRDPHGTPIVTVQSAPSGGVRSLDWSPDGSMIVAGGSGNITVYDATTLEIVSQEADAHTSRVNDVAFSPDGSKIASGGNDGALKLWQAPVPGACTLDLDCEDFNECTADTCDGGVCRFTPTSDESPCAGGSGICCSGSCSAAICIDDFDCNDGETCSIDTCISGGTCAATCDSSFPECGLFDTCCGLSCSQNSDSDCICVPTHNKEKGPRCSDDIDNDCDGLVDAADPDC